MSKVKIVKVMSELGAGTRGSSMGFDAILTASHKKRSDLLSKFPIVEVPNENQMLFNEIDTPYAKHVKGIAKVYNRIATTFFELIENDEFPVVVAASHDTAGGTIRALKDKNPNKRIGVVWIDAHADLHSPYTTPSGNVHGMPLGAALKEDNKENAINNPDEETLSAWGELCGDSPAIEAQDLVFFGVRDTEIPEDELILRKGIKNYTVEEVRRRGVKECSREALERLKDVDIIYISFDVDSMDSSISDGTGTPVINGFSLVEANKIISYLLDDRRVCCFEMVEINPTLDTKGNVMAENAFFVLERAIKKIASL